jgi:hypothetical protein
MGKPVIKETHPDEIAELLNVAADIYCLVPGAGKTSMFTQVNAMLMAGMESTLANAFIPAFDRTVRGLIQRNGNPSFSAQTKLDRAVGIYRLARFSIDGTKVKERAEIMRLVGYAHESTSGSSAEYKKLERTLMLKGLYIPKSRKPKQEVPIISAPIIPALIKPANNIITDGLLITKTMKTLQEKEQGGSSRGVSIISVDNTILVEGDDKLSPLSELGEEDTVFSFATSSETSSKVGGSRTRGQKISQDEAISAVSSQSTGNNNHRKTSKDTQLSRRQALSFAELEKQAFKIGTVLWDGAKTGRNVLEKFDTANKCAEEINLLFDVTCGRYGKKLDIISGRRLESGVHDGLIGISPPRKGRSR